MVSCLPAPPGPSDARRCLLIFQPAARPRAAAVEGTSHAASPQLDPAATLPGPAPPAHAVAGPAGSQEPGPDPCTSPAADAAATDAALPPPETSQSEAAPEPGAAPSAAEAGDRDAAGQVSAASEPSMNPSFTPAAEPSSAEQHEAAAQTLRAMALVDGVSPESPFVRASAGFQARVHSFNTSKTLTESYMRICPRQGPHVVFVLVASLLSMRGTKLPHIQANRAGCDGLQRGGRARARLPVPGRATHRRARRARAAARAPLGPPARGAAAVLPPQRRAPLVREQTACFRVHGPSGSKAWTISPTLYRLKVSGLRMFP